MRYDEGGVPAKIRGRKVCEKSDISTRGDRKAALIARVKADYQGLRSQQRPPLGVIQERSFL
jgi:hypothetical protein